MTTEEKAKAYDEAIERAKGIHHFSSDIAEIKRMEDIFPELKESEDEKIRKSIIAIINNYVDNSNTFKPKMLAWLEKQSRYSSTVGKYFITPEESEEERIRKALLEYFGEECDTATINGIYCYKIYDWLKKQGEKKETNPTLQEKDRMDDAFTKMMLKPQVDGFDAELNSLLKKYEHLPKEEILGCLNFYVLVLGKEIEERQ